MVKRKNLFKDDTTDEFYTLKEDTNKIIEHFKEKLKNKTIFLPCDTEESNFYKTLKEREKELNLKIIINNHFEDNLFHLNNIDNYKNCDIVMTNPPFSKMKEFLDILNYYQKDVILIVSFMDVFSYNLSYKRHFLVRYFDYYGKIKENHRKSNSFVGDILVCNSIHEIPNDYKGKLLLPANIIRYKLTDIKILSLKKYVLNNKKFFRILCEKL